MAFDGTLKFDTAIDKSGFKAGIDSLGSIAEAGMKVVKGLALTTTAAVTAAGAAIGALTKSAIEGYADYEQLVGGVETLFGAGGQSLEDYAASVGKTVDGVRAEYEMLSAAQEEVLANADNAFRTAGMSANDYMETVTSFSAALIQSLGGDTLAAAQKADMAITDMADNINKMGSDAESVENAYKGFAKQNFTMLDNLKLGYGGTKEEMQRLLADAEKISGVKYDISSYADIVDAIHVVQTEMGITGTTAREAASTIQGSMSMASAAWDNFITGMADPESDFDALLGNLIDSIVIVGDNLIPRITATVPRLVEGVSELISELAGYIPDIVQELLPAFMEGAEELVSAVTDILPQLLSIVGELVPQLVDSVMTLLPQLADAGAQIAIGIYSGLEDNLPMIAEKGIQLLEAFADSLSDGSAVWEAFDSLFFTAVGIITDNLPRFADAATKIITAMITGLTGTIPKLTAKMPEIISGISNALLSGLPQIADCTLLLLGSIVEAVPDVVTALADVLPILIETAAEVLISGAPMLIASAETLLMGIVEALPAVVEALSTALPTLINTASQLLISGLPLIIRAAMELLMGIVTALPAVLDALVKALPQIVESIVVFFVSEQDAVVEAGIELLGGLLQALPFIILELAGALPEVILAIVEGLIDGTSQVQDAADRIWQSIKDVFSGVGDFFKGVWQEAVDNTTDIIGSVVGFFDGIWDDIASGATSGINWLISKVENGINYLIGGLNGIGFDLPDIMGGGHVGFDVPEVSLPRLAQGGIVDSPTIAQIGEAGREAVIPLENNTGWIAQLAEEIARLLRPSPQPSGIIIPESAVQAFASRSAAADTSLSAPSPTSDIVNNYNSYSTYNNAPAAQPQPMTINAQFVVGEEVVAEGVIDLVSDEIDERQGVKIELSKRGVTT